MFGISWGVLPPPSGIDELDIPQAPGQQAVGAPSTSPDATNLPYERPMDVIDAPKLSYQVEKLPPEATRFTADGAPQGRFSAFSELPSLQQRKEVTSCIWSCDEKAKAL